MDKNCQITIINLIFCIFSCGNKYFHPWHNYTFSTLICRQSFKDKNALLKNDYKLVTNIWILYIVGIFDHLLLSITRQQIPSSMLQHSKINWQRQLLQFKIVLMAVTNLNSFKSKKIYSIFAKNFQYASLKACIVIIESVSKICFYKNIVFTNYSIQLLFLFFVS